MKNKGRIFILFLVGLVAAGLAVYLYFLSFNRVVQERFEGQLWELPARVYARPLELYSGMGLRSDMLEKELGLMAYQKISFAGDLDGPGKYSRSGNTFEIFSRSFDFGDKKLSSHRLEVKIEKDRVAVLKGLGGYNIPDMVRLDPVLLGNFYPASREDRILVDLDKLPSLLPKTIICVEDRTFYTHHGVVPKAIFRAMLVNLKNRKMTQGASTITQQLARNFFLTKKKTLGRKLNELFMAGALELNYTKNDILEAYINEVYLGQDGNRSVHGFGLASVFYFGKSLQDLNAPEVALLVGLLKGPSYYNPRKYPDRAIKRRNTVLKEMALQGILSEIQEKKALARPLGVIKQPNRANSPFPAYLDLVKRQLLKEYREEDLRSMGLKIFTALDPQVQLAAEHTVGVQLDRLARNRGLNKKKLEASVVVTATGSNEILAMVGGKNFRSRGFNRAIDARRPIGSLIKPAIYLTALSHPDDYTLVTRVADEPINIPTTNGGDWAPRNFDRKYRGQIPLYLALVNSYNVPTVRVGMDLGLAQVLDTLHKMGFKRDVTMYPSSLLGSLEMSPMEVAQIYQTLASGGFYSAARSIRAIYKSDGELVQRYPLTIEQHLDPAAVFLLNKMLQAVVVEGTAKSLKNIMPIDLGIAAKTGSSNSLKDSWFAGFSGNRLAVVWVGRDDNRSCKLTGAAGAMQIFGHLMARIPNQPLALVSPENVEWAVIDANSGLLTAKTCPNAMAIPFIRGSAPTKTVSCTPWSSSPNTSGKKEKPRYLLDWLRRLIK
ncbi:MAG: penicillin-binding protein 1B [Desulfobacteraceae bacterium]|nr:penicillin-binding protein 1B [Desulfobacteraceae bacterium]